MSSNAKSTKTEGGWVNLKIIEPSWSITTCGESKVPDESETPASKTTLLFSPGRPASMNASSSTWKMIKSSFVNGFQSYTIAILLLALSVLLINLSPILNWYVVIPVTSSSWVSSKTTLWSYLKLMPLVHPVNLLESLPVYLINSDPRRTTPLPGKGAVVDTCKFVSSLSASIVKPLML